jgi:glycosyltransferase involved in cell wall biosynthesis
MRRIKVVHLTNLDMSLKVQMGNYLRYQRDQGYDVSAITRPGRWLLTDTTTADGLFVKIIPFQSRMTPFEDVRTLVRLIRYFRQEQFDVVHTHTVKPGLLGRVAAKAAGVPVIVHTLHGLFLSHELMTPFQYRLFRMIAKLGSACCHSVLSQNHEDIGTAIRLRICSPHKISYLGNGIDLARFDPALVSPAKVRALRAELKILPQQPVVGMVARLVREKGVYEFCEAARTLKSRGIQARYLMIGSAPPTKQTSVSAERLVREYGLDEDVILADRREDIPELLSLMDVVVLASHGIEGIPRILMESGAMGKPVVASRARGNVEVVEDGKTGLLVPARDASALAEAVLCLLRDPQRAAEMGRQARQRALADFDERAYFWKTDAEYRRLLRARLKMDPGTTLKPVPSTFG